MDRHKVLYENKIHAMTKSDTEKRRALQNQQRRDKRKILHENGRNILIDQTEQPEKDAENKENHTDGEKSTESKLNHRKKYIERFIEWKKMRLLEKEAKEKKRRHPNAAAAIMQQQPPEAIYIFKSKQTKNGVRIVNEHTNDQITTTKRIIPKLNIKELNNITVQKSKLSKTVGLKPIVSATSVTTKKPEAISKFNSFTKKPEAISKFNSITQKSEATISKETNPTIKEPPKVVNCFATGNTDIIKRPVAGGAIGKVRQLQQNSQRNVTNKKRATNLGVSLKVKKPTTTTAAKGVKQFLVNQNKNSDRLQAPLQQNKEKPKTAKTAVQKQNGIGIKTYEKAVNKNLLLCLPNNVEDKDLNTPLDLLRHSGRFDPSITSTHQKNNSGHMHKFDFDERNDGKLRVPTSTRKSLHNSSAKNYARLFNFVKNNDSILASSSDSNEDETLAVLLKPENMKENINEDSKETNISTVQKLSEEILVTDNNKTLVASEKPQTARSSTNLENEEEKSKLIRQNAIDSNMENCLETKLNDETFTEEKVAEAEVVPCNFVSSFVSVSRGKGSARKEHKKREDMYLNNTLNDISTEKPETEKPLSNNTSFSVEDRRTLEAVHYFHQQLNEETARLHKQCEYWEKYRDENEGMLEEVDCLGMIAAAVGQTRLLTSKKFQQFRGLISRCEAQLTGIGIVPDDGSEDTKSITPIDLEGFWCMLGLQLNNLAKYFENLDRWKANNWADPDAVKKKPAEKVKLLQKKKPVPTNKAKPKATSSLRDMIRKALAEKSQKTDIMNNNNSVMILTAGTKSNVNAANKNNTASPKRRSILVKDRKQFSNSPTILKVCSPKRKRLSQASQSNELLKSALIGAANEVTKMTPFKVTATSPLITPRTSILKTPNLQKSAVKRQVSFCAKDIKFILSSSEDESDEDMQ